MPYFVRRGNIVLKINLRKYLLSFNFSVKIKDLEIKHIELNILKNEILEWNKKSWQIQSNFDFPLPQYLINEIIETEKSKDYFNLYYLINCAVINGRISEGNGKKIKQLYILK